MGHINLAEAKAHLSDLVARVEAGEAIQISRRGRPVVQITRIDQPRKPIDVAGLRAVIDTMSRSPAGSVVRAMRDEARY